MAPENDIHCSESFFSACVLWLASSLSGLHSDKIGIVMRALCDARVCRASSKWLLGVSNCSHRLHFLRQVGCIKRDSVINAPPILLTIWHLQRFSISGMCKLQQTPPSGWLSPKQTSSRLRSFYMRRNSSWTFRFCLWAHSYVLIFLWHFQCYRKHNFCVHHTHWGATLEL